MNSAMRETEMIKFTQLLAALQNGKTAVVRQALSEKNVLGSVSWNLYLSFGQIEAVDSNGIAVATWKA
jgi:hypothetical protein